MCQYLGAFSEVDPNQGGPVKLVSDVSADITGITAVITSRETGNVEVLDTLLIPYLRHNLLSVAKIMM